MKLLLITNSISQLQGDIRTVGKTLIPKTVTDLIGYITISGSILISCGYPPSYAILLWSICNPYFLYHNYTHKDYTQTKMYVAYTVINMYGIYNFYIK